MRAEELSEFLQILRGGKPDDPVDEIVRTWRHAGIGTSHELARWLAVAVFDGYRAGLLKAVGIVPEALDELALLREVGPGSARSNDRAAAAGRSGEPAAIRGADENGRQAARRWLAEKQTAPGSPVRLTAVVRTRPFRESWRRPPAVVLEELDGLPVGYSFAIGKLGVRDIQERVAKTSPCRENTG